MKYIKVIDGADNCVYDIFGCTDSEFALIFPQGPDVAFIEEVYPRGDSQLLDSALNIIWFRRQIKSEVQGLHGLLLYGLETKKVYYPNRGDADANNPDGSRERWSLCNLSQPPVPPMRPPPMLVRTTCLRRSASPR